MLRPTEPADTPAILSLAEATGAFKPLEIVALGEVLDDYHAANRAAGHLADTLVDGEILGFVYYAPAAMTDRTWYLYWIAVAPQAQAKGLGGTMLAHVEQQIRQRTGRQLLVETSSLPSYDLTRKFYAKHNYQIAATIADYYADGDSMVVFAKRLDG